MVYLFDDFKSQIPFRSGTAENCRSNPVLASPLEHISGTTWGFKQSRYISPYDLKSCRHVKPLQFTNDKIVNRKVNSLWLFILLVDYHIFTFTEYNLDFFSKPILIHSAIERVEMSTIQL